jgi:alpha-ketoglutarate-dependent dioxygenase FTO
MSKFKNRKRKKQQISKTEVAGETQSDRQQQQHHATKRIASATAVPPATLPPGRKFWTDNDAGFAAYVKSHYQGFVHFPAHEYEPRIQQQQQQQTFHEVSRRALEKLRDANYYQYDVVMAGGKHSSRTFVKRTLVGNPGITYKYLGLRLFAHAWSGPGVSPALRAIGEMNRRIVELTKRLPNPGKCEYNLTLINYMEPHSHTSVGFKDDTEGMGKVSVSWHSDSSLEANSAIAVYHCLPTQRATKWDWRIALRPAPNGNGDDENGPSIRTQAAPVAINTKDGDMYFLLGDFNEKYQHCVLAGSQANRISSTHRVAVTSEDTYDYILKRVKIARKRFRLQLEDEGRRRPFSPSNMDAKIIRYCQRVLTEVEMEWIAQYWLQGAQHDKMHVWWQRPMKTLEAYFEALEQHTFQLYKVCLQDDTVPIDVIKVMKNELKERRALRLQWDERRKDKIYAKRIAAEYRPVARPLYDDSKGNNDDERLPKDLTNAINGLSEVLKRRLAGTKSVSKESSPLVT